VPVYHRGYGKPDGERALAAAAFLSGQNDASCLPFPANSTLNAKM
jgi:hypothetical protein